MHADQILPKEALDYPLKGRFKISIWESMFDCVSLRSEYVEHLFNAGIIIGELINACDAEYHKHSKLLPKVNLCDYVAFVNYKTIRLQRDSLEDPSTNAHALNEAYLEM